jgi:two-component system, NarL family, response regulator NreC
VYATKVLLLDDHPVVTEGLRLLLDAESDLAVVGTAASLEEALATPGVPDVIVADLVLGADGAGATVAALLDRFPDGRVLVLTMVDDPDAIHAALAAGAQGYLLKEAAAGDLVDAVRRVACGEDYLQPAVGAMLARARTSDTTAFPPDLLSPRESEVARLLALGHTNAEIAELLGVSERTVESHRARLLEKLGVRTRADLVRRATELGLVDLSGL